MARKKKAESNQRSAVSDQQSAVSDQQSAVSDQQSGISDQQPATPSEESKIGYTVGQWAGHPQFRCKECAFDTLDLDVMLEHLLRVHSVIALNESAPPSEPSPPTPLPEGEGSEVERADGIFEIDLKEDQ